MPTALITGASRGIGAAYARYLAEHGWTTLLIGRDEGRLQAVADTLATPGSLLLADLAQPEEAERVARRIRETPDLELLVNNAGFGTTALFAEAEPGRQLEMLRLHVEAPTRLTRAALPGMLRRGRGGIVHVASIAAFLPGPGLANYSASKRFLVSQAEALALEVRGRGLKVQALCPGFTVTDFHSTEEYRSFDRRRVPSWLWMTPEEVVRCSARALTAPHAPVVVIPGWRNRLIVALMGNPLTRGLMRAARRR